MNFLPSRIASGQRDGDVYIRWRSSPPRPGSRHRRAYRTARGARRLMRRDLLSDFQLSAVLKVRGNSRSPKRVVPNLRLNPRSLCTAAELQLFDIRGNLNRFDSSEIEQSTPFAPVRKAARGLVVGPQRVSILNIRREEFPEALG